MREDDMAEVEQVTELRFQFKGKFAELTLPDEMLEAMGGVERLSGYLAGINDGEERGILHMLKPVYGWVPIIVGAGYMGPMRISTGADGSQAITGVDEPASE